MSILGKIKKGVATSGSNKGKLLYFKADSKTRVRFLSEVEDGIEVVMHDSFDRGINVICRAAFGEECDYCEDESLRTRPAYVWSTFEYDAKEVKLFLGFANNFSPLPSIIAMYESYGTVMDRDYVIQQDGSGTNKRFGVVPMDKVKFKNTKAKPYSKKKVLEILDKAYPSDATPDDDEDDEEEKVTKKKSSAAKKSKKKKPDPEPEEDDWDEEEEEAEEEEVEVDDEYEDMSAKELYMECTERGLKAKKKQKESYYIKLLEKDDAANDNEDDEDEDDEDEW